MNKSWLQAKRNLLIITTAFVLCISLGRGEARAQKEDAPKLEVGVFFTSLSFRHLDFAPDETRPGIGGRVSYNLNDHVALEAETSLLAHRSDFFSSGGQTWQGQFGVKAGKRFEKFGVFAKARPGFVSFGRAAEVVGFDSITTPEGPVVFPDFRFGRKTHFSTDIGGVLELYPTRRILARFDIGDTIIFYRDRTGFTFGPPATVFSLPDAAKHNFQFSAGVGFRF